MTTDTAIVDRAPSAPAALRLHLRQPDYTRPLLEIPAEGRRRILGLLALLYGDEPARDTFAELERILRVYYAHKTPEMIEADRVFDPADRFDERDIVLITYGDLLRRDHEPPLRVLADFLDDFACDINTVHLLPFFPSSSDRGFAVTDYEEVDPRLGSWEDVERLALRFELMFDGVFNHVSAQSRWFQRFLNGHPMYQDFFIGFNTREAIGNDHLKLILRPRASDLLTCFQAIDGPRFVWTTFSPDQIDLNYRNPAVMLRMVDVLLHYARRNADMIRLDAATYLWRELGTSCAHLVQTHAIVKLFRAVLDVVAPRVALITETNVPHEDNISYFGDGTDEAQMVYNFALPPLVLLALQRGDCDHLAAWARTLDKVSDRATYFNFLASHDGIGLLPVQGILPPEEIEWLVERTRAHGGLVSFRTDRDGNRVPYELNITWWSALNAGGGDEPLGLQVDRFIASRSIAMALRGVPGIYIASLIGSRNDLEGVTASGEARSINRQVLDEASLRFLIEDSDEHAALAFGRMNALLAARTRSRAFHPNGDQRVIRASPRVFTLTRRAPDDSVTVIAATNVTCKPQRLELGGDDIGMPTGREWRDLLTGRVHAGDADRLRLELAPYEVLWLES